MIRRMAAWTAAATLAGTACAEDLSEWRGAGRDGTVAGGPNLIEAMPTNGLKALWDVPIPGRDAGNYSSPVGADGRAYVHVSWLRMRPIETRRLNRDVRKRLGAEPPKELTAELAAQLEAARLGEERRALTGRPLDTWASEWIAANTGTNAADKAVRTFAGDRLKRGANALSADGWVKLLSLGDVTFASQAELEKALAGAGLAADDARRIDGAMAKEESYREDTLVCVNLGDGTVAWQKAWPTVNSGRGASNTPCVRDGRVYFVGCAGTVYCLDAKTGETMWTADKAAGGQTDSSVTVTDGRLIVQSGKGLLILDAASGKVLLHKGDIKSNSNSPSLWQTNGKTYVIAAGDTISCVDPADGRILWQVPGSKWTTPAVAGDTMAVAVSEKGVYVYRLSMAEPRQVAFVEVKSRSCSPVTDGQRVYVLARDTGFCLDAATGEELWRSGGNNDTYASPLLADGKLIGNHRRGLLVYDAATGKALGSADITFAECTSLGLVDGRLLARDDDSLACYDLRARR